MFFTSPEQKRVAERLIARLVELGYHQDYYARKGGKPYCHVPVERFDERGPSGTD